jgi:hypothetical protein
VKLTKTLKTLRQIMPSVSDSVHAPNDALLVSNIELVLRVLKMETKSLPEERLEPRLVLELSRLFLSVGDEHRALAMFKRAASFVDQNRGYYSDIGYCSKDLCRESESEDFRLAVQTTVQVLLEACPFPDDLQRALG